MGDAGTSDGEALTSARLTFPTDCCADSNGLYFTEQSRSPSIRCYKNQTVATLISGAPLKNPSGICIGTGNNLFVCDRSASCVWSVSIDARCIFAMISLNDIPSLPPTAGCAGASFSPAGIIRVADGVYAFTDLTRQVIYRYIDGPTADAAVGSASDLAQKSQDNIDQYVNTVSSIVAAGMSAISKTTDSAKAVIKLRRSQQLAYYISEVQRSHALLSHKGSLCHEAIILMIRHAPSLRAISRFFAEVSISPDLQRIAKESFALYLNDYEFNSMFSDVKDDVQALGDIFRLAPEVVGQEELCVILKNDK